VVSHQLPLARVIEMAQLRAPDGRVAPDPRFDSKDARAALLLEHLAGNSTRVLGVKYGLSKTAIANYLKTARVEEAARKAAIRAGKAAAAPSPQPRRPVNIFVLTSGVDLRGREGQVLASEEGFRLTRRANSSDAATAVRAERELERLVKQANLRAGLSPQGTALIKTPGGTRTSYQPDDPADVERVRGIIRDESGDEAADNWQPHPGLR
jgi:hypothetical protein